MEILQILVLFIFLAVQYSEQTNDCDYHFPAKKYWDECAYGRWKGRDDFWKNDHCFRSCYHKKLGYYDDKGKLSALKISEFWYNGFKNKEIAKKIAEISAKCVDEGLLKDNECDMSYTYHECLRKNKELQDIFKNEYCHDFNDWEKYCL